MPYIHYYKNNSFPAEHDLPFQWHVNFKRLINWWEGQATLTDSFQSDRAKEVLQHIKKIPQLSKSFDDVSMIEKYHEEINLLLSPFFPSLITTEELKAASLPFKQMLFNLTNRFTNLLKGAQDENLMSEINAELIYMFGCITILNGYYKANISISPNLFFSIRNKKTSIVQKYRAFINFDFTEILPLKNAKPLTDKDIYELTNNFGNAQLWKQKIPPESFSFEGFTIMTLFDVTHDESISALKFDLLKKDALTSPDIVEQIQESLSAMLNIPRLKTGFISYNKERELLQSFGFSFGNSILLSDKRDVKMDEIFSDNTKVSFKKNEPLVLQIGNKAVDENILIKTLSRTDLKSYLAVPLFYNDELIGILEVGSELPNSLNTITVYKLRETLSLFTIAMKRSQDETKDQIDAIILQKFTAIHSSVAWRFVEAAEKVLEARMRNNDYTMEEIIFPEVYPLYGEFDIKGSSLERNRSIQHDLIEQLSLAKNILNLAVNKSAIPLYRDLHYRVENYIQQLQQKLSAGDENVLEEFLKEEISPAFKHLNGLGGDIPEAIEDYKKQLDPVLGMVYKKRKDYDQSVKILNDHISGYFDKAELAAQNMFPHYFERYQSDGVEHNLYIGQSMVNNKKFHQLYLQNLRLWQLIITCEVENEIYRIKPDIKSKLDICSLILVHSQPLAIRFRMEEKKFDVDGPFNAQYEIIKKRIGKAIVRETNERLTQPGKIAIIYFNDKEAKEYINYIHYLQSINYISSEIEWFTLKDLQGATGLKALRISVLYSKSRETKESKAVELLKKINLN
ncbi:MAG: hypothetical protein ABI237_14360 [Ginsengibacter sp.]